MFDHRHYVPVLRWKGAEILALSKLSKQDKGVMTPLIEIIPDTVDINKIRKAGSLTSRLTEVAAEFSSCWGTSPFFLDCSALTQKERDALKLQVMTAFPRLAKMYYLNVIPTVEVGCVHELNLAISRFVGTIGEGAAIRIKRHDIFQKSLKADIEKLMRDLNCSARQTDLIIDLELMDTTIAPLAGVLDAIPHLTEWRTLTLMGGVFPEDLRDYRKNNEYELSRSDWLYWLHETAGLDGKSRLPSFGDYTIQHALLKPKPAKPHFSASIRYASDTYWVIIKGQDVFDDEGPGFSQWPVNAKMLCTRSEFCGKNFSYGDAYIVQMSGGTNGTGRAKEWLCAGINHHLALTARQVAKLAA